MSVQTEDVALTIDGAYWRSWGDLEIKRAIDAVSTFSFGAPFEPERAAFRSTFKPFTFKPLKLETNGEDLLTGVLVGVEPSIDAERREVAVSGYSKPGVLGDVCMPAHTFPVAYDGMKLSQIAKVICDEFALDLVVEGSDGAPFDRTAMEPTQSPFAFLAELAKQRSMVISDTPSGALRIWQPPTSGSAVVRLKEGTPPLVAMSPSYQPQAYFSEITGLKNANAGRAGGRHTEPNPLTTSKRPHSFTVEDADKGDVPAATKAKLARMFGNMFTVTVDVPTWRDPSGALWEPNAFVNLEAPGAMIYTPTDFIIREVTLRQNAENISASLALVLPGAFSGGIPTRFPWD